jgi:hypothetical protein
MELSQRTSRPLVTVEDICARCTLTISGGAGRYRTIDGVYHAACYEAGAKIPGITQRIAILAALSTIKRLGRTGVADDIREMATHLDIRLAFRDDVRELRLDDEGALRVH